MSLHVKCPSLLPAFNQNWKVTINVSKTWDIAGFYRGVNFFPRLGCYAVYVGHVTDVSGQHMCSIFIGQAVLTVEDGTDVLPRKVGN